MSTENLSLSSEAPADSHTAATVDEENDSSNSIEQQSKANGSEFQDGAEKISNKPKPSGRNEDQPATLPSMGILAPEVSPSECSASGGITASPERSEPVNANRVLHKVKRIRWNDIAVSILTQNKNGPCPLMAILNALILKGVITLPVGKDEFSGEELVSILANAVFDVPQDSVPTEMHQYLEQNTDAAVSILHKLLTGLDVNVIFSGVRNFEFTLDLSVFDVLRVPLYHGWVADPDSEFGLVREYSYNQLTNNIITWGIETAETSDNDLFLKMTLAQDFLSTSVSQLTIYGLFELGATMKDEEIAVLFRNNHFSTIYKREGLLYLLLTDQGFLHEKAVWETLNDVDATFSSFVTEKFRAIGELRQPLVKETGQATLEADAALARMLQEENEQAERNKKEFQKEIADLGLENMDDEAIALALHQKELDRLNPESEARQRPVQPTETPKSVDKKKKECRLV